MRVGITLACLVLAAGEASAQLNPGPPADIKPSELCMGIAKQLAEATQARGETLARYTTGSPEVAKAQAAEASYKASLALSCYGEEGDKARAYAYGLQTSKAKAAHDMLLQRYTQSSPQIVTSNGGIAALDAAAHGR